MEIEVDREKDGDGGRQRFRWIEHRKIGKENDSEFETEGMNK